MQMDQTDRTKYKSLYIQTTREYADELIKNMPLFIKNPQDIEVLKKLHLISHSLKSQSILMGYNGVGNIALLLEKIFKEQADNPHVFDGGETETIQSGVNLLTSSIDLLEREDKEPDVSVLSSSLEKIAGKYYK